MKSTLLLTIKRLLTIAFLALAWPTLAAEHGGEAAGPAPMQFVVNIGETVATMNLLQIALVLECATPAAEQRLARVKPKIQHRLILLLSAEKVASLQTTKGKQELQERIVKDLNELIDETPETGVKEVFFTSFIIQ